jgi:hypothetical protein
MRGRAASLALAALLVGALAPGVTRELDGARAHVYESKRPHWRDCGAVKVRRPFFHDIRTNRVQARGRISCATARYIGRHFHFGGYQHKGLTCYYAGMGSGNPYWNWSCDRGPGVSLRRVVRGHGPAKLKSSSAAASRSCSRKTARSLERTLPAWRNYIKPYAGRGQVLCFDFAGDIRRDILFTSWGAMNHGAHFWSAFQRTSRSWKRLAFKKSCCGRKVHALGIGISIKHRGRTIVVEEPVYRATDPACCPTGGTRQGRWRWRSGHLLFVGTVSAAGSCPHPEKLRATRRLRRALRKTHSAFLRRFNSPGVKRGPVGRVYVGRCGSRQYAAATFVHAVTGETDQPEWFSRRDHRRWRDRGDTGGDLAASGVPKPLLRLWGVL